MKRFLGILFAAVLLSGAFAQTMNVAWPYKVPPEGHFNSLAKSAINLGVYIDLMVPPLATYHWADGTYEGIAAESFGFASDGSYTVTLKKGHTWSDGTPINADDLLTTFNAKYLTGATVWNNLKDVVKVDDMTAKFIMKEPSVATERLILVENLRPTSVFGDFASRAAALRNDGKDKDSEEIKAVLGELTEFRPAEYVSGGPFVMDTSSITDANIKLLKNEGGVGSDTTAFADVTVWNGETETVFPIVVGGQLWYATHGFSPVQEEALVKAGLDIIRNPYYSGPALYFNQTNPLFANPVFRQAVAYAIDRDENGFVSLGESGVAVEYMTGVSDNLIGAYLDQDTLDSMNTYDFNLDKAAELMTSLGYAKGSDGIWANSDGKLSFEMIFPAEYADWSAAAENAAQALNAFGIEIKAKGVQFQQQRQDVYDGAFEIAIRNWGTSSPFPYRSYLQPYDRYNGQGELAGEGKGGGMHYDPNITYSGGALNVLDLANEAGKGADTAKIKSLVKQLAVSFNETLPIVPLWERFGNNPLNRKMVDAPPASDPIFLNSGTDHFMPYMIITGKVKPAK